MSKLLAILSFLALTNCSMVWFNQERPFTKQPVKCSENYIPAALDVAGGLLLTGLAWNYRNQRDQVVVLGLGTAAYTTSAYVGFVSALNCEEK